MIEKFNARAEEVNSLVCVGLDSDFAKIPERFKNLPEPQFAFNQYLIEQTQQYAAAYKCNSAFYEARGEQGIRELKKTLEYLRGIHPDIYTIDDAKRADIGNTNAGYVTFILDWLGFDAMTLHPYLGQEALSPFLDRKDKSFFVLCRTSNPGAGELQDINVGGKPLWQVVAEKVAREWNGNTNCGLVVGATYPHEMQKVRELVGEMTLLVPGVGAQGGDVKATVRAGKNKAGKGIIINSSRGIIFADDPAQAAKDLQDAINQYR